MKSSLTILIATLMLAAAAGTAGAGEDGCLYPWHRNCPPQAEKPDAAPTPEPGRKSAERDDRITDATTDFDPSLYPKGPVAQLVFWGFEGAKTDYNKAEDAFCDQDVAVLKANLERAAAGMPAQDAARLSVSKKVLTKTSEYCPEGGEDRHSGSQPKPECRTVRENHCGAVLASASPRFALRFVQLPAMSTKAECDAALAAQAARGAVIDSHEAAGPQGRGCVPQALEIIGLAER